MLTIATIGDLDAVRGTRVESAWRTVTQAMIDTFAAVTDDRQWIHVDPPRAAAESPFHTTIAHGFLTLSLLSAMLGECVSLPGVVAINYGFERVRFLAPVPSGARVRGRFTLGDVQPHGKGAVNAVWEVEVEIEGGEKPAVAATWIVRLMFA
ncbi:MAG TPA: MaoC family dehydratase [Candidatus Acidoferrales bacterium]|nr:MaoC family dehydratase [Candidatus Acidoferrales bacterium]